MPAFLQELLTQLKGIWARLDGGQRATILSVVGAAVVGLVALVWYAQQPDWEVVYKAEDSYELNQAMTVLSSAGIGYKESGISALAVKSTDFTQARRALLAEGVGSSGSSSDLELSMTDPEEVRKYKLFTKRLREIEDAIRAMREVRSVRIVANVPERSIYTLREQAIPKTAAVHLSLRHGAPFHKIAEAAQRAVVAGLSIPKNGVTVFDENSKMTFGGDPRGGFSGGSFQERQLARAEEKRRRAQELLDAQYPDQALVEVDVELDPKIQTVRRPHIAETPAILEQTKRKTQSTDPRNVPNGDPSTQAATNGLANGTAAAAAARSEKTEDTSVTYADPGQVEEMTADFEIDRIQVALVLDKDIAMLADAAGDPAQLETRKAEIEAVVKRAVGFDEQRGDQIQTILSDLEPPEPLPPLETGPGFGEIAREWGPVVGQVLAVGFVLFFLRGLFRTAASKSPARAVAVAGGTTGGGMSPQGAVDEVSADEQMKRMRREIERSIAEDPAAMSRMLESWLAEQTH